MRSLLRLFRVTGTLAGAARPADAQAVREALTAANKQGVVAQQFPRRLKVYSAGDSAAAGRLELHPVHLGADKVRR